jgi:hypothetical protein
LARLNISEFDLIYIQIASKYDNTVKFPLERKGIKAFKVRESLRKSIPDLQKWSKSMEYGTYNIIVRY